MDPSSKSSRSGSDARPGRALDLDLDLDLDLANTPSHSATWNPEILNLDSERLISALHFLSPRHLLQLGFYYSRLWLLL